MASPGTDVTPQAADLDGIAPLDAVLPLGQCGNWGDCMYVVLLACGGSGYRPIWGPDYAQRIEVLQRTPDAPLANLRYIDRTAAAGCDLAVQTVLHWSGGSWIGGASCTSSGVWDVEVCGPLPAPRCSG